MLLIKFDRSALKNSTAFYPNKLVNKAFGHLNLIVACNAAQTFSQLNLSIRGSSSSRLCLRLAGAVGGGGGRLLGGADGLQEVAPRRLGGLAARGGLLDGADGLPELLLGGGARRRGDHVLPDGAGAAGGGAVGVEVVHGGGLLVQPAHLVQAVDLPRLHKQAAVEPVLPRDQLPRIHRCTIEITNQ